MRARRTRQGRRTVVGVGARNPEWSADATALLHFCIISLVRSRRSPLVRAKKLIGLPP
jgi:hypothetical protein